MKNCNACHYVDKDCGIKVEDKEEGCPKFKPYEDIPIWSDDWWLNRERKLIENFIKDIENICEYCPVSNKYQKILKEVSK